MSFGNEIKTVHHCPSHTPDHVVFSGAKDKEAIVGDVLFRSSVGRSDLPGGDRATLIRSIREKLWLLGDETTFVPGQGSLLTFGRERQSNPFVSDHLFS